MTALRWLAFVVGVLVVVAFFAAGRTAEDHAPQLGPFPTGDGDRTEVRP